MASLLPERGLAEHLVKHWIALLVLKLIDLIGNPGLCIFGRPLKEGL